MSPSPLIWFVLLDPDSGRPFKDTTVSSIFRSSLSVPVVDLFRDAVKAKYSNKLSSFDSGELLVYKNKAAFDKRNAAVDEGKEEPLKSSRTLVGFGETEEEALIVVVPSSMLPSLTQNSSFPLCHDPFYNSICNATEVDGWISFGHNIPSTTLNKLYVRESYGMIASLIYPGINKAIITGTPGIGKSLFLIYLLWKLVKEGRRVLLIYHPSNIYYDGKGGVFRFPGGHLPLDDDDSFWNNTLWCLFDAKYRKEADLGKFPISHCNFILSTSPRREMVNDFKKPPVPEVFYMPTWTKEELGSIAPLFPNSMNWPERFITLGGIPRFVLEDTGNDALAILEAACSECSLDDCIRKVSMNSDITDKSKVIHSLVHIESKSPFIQSSVCYASDRALELIVEHKGQEATRKMRSLLESCRGNPLTAALCGYIFEPYAIKLLERGGSFKCRQLVQGKKGDKPKESTLYIEPSTKSAVEGVKPDQTINQLYVPISRTFKGIDAWIPGIGAFQMTVGKSHEIKDSAIEILKTLENRLYWVLPPLYYQSFTQKKPETIEQHAVLIPYPQVVEEFNTNGPSEV